MQDQATLTPIASPVSLGHVPGPRWAFDESVAKCFDDMLARSIPDYAAMRRLCFDVGSRFVQFRTDILDLGCSRGEALAAFVAKFGAENRYVGVEVSPPMAEAASERFAGLISRNVVEVRTDDLRFAYPPSRASLTLAVLTLQFIPIEYRQQVLRQAYRHTIPGGALIVVEKVLGSDDSANRALVSLYHDLKKANGYTSDEIDRKRFALEGVLVPVTAKWNEDLIRSAGFGSVECFWRHLNFAAWVAIKE